jgi:hypothetical protein
MKLLVTFLSIPLVVYSCSKSNESSNKPNNSQDTVASSGNNPSSVDTPILSKHYIVNKKKLLLCTMNDNTGLFTSCVDSGAKGLIDPKSVVVVEKSAYISDFTAAKIFRCVINNDATIESCADSKAFMPIQNALKPHPYGLTYSGGFIYAVFQGANYEYNGVYKYSIASDTKNLINPKEEPNANYYPLHVSIFNGFAYLSNWYNKTGLSICNVDKSGDFSNCHFILKTDGTTNNLKGYGSSTSFLNKENVFIQLHNSLYNCPLLSDGSIDQSKCTNTNISKMSGYGTVTIINGNAYVTGTSTDILKCSIVNNKISADTCTDSKATSTQESSLSIVPVFPKSKSP